MIIAPSMPLLRRIFIAIIKRVVNNHGNETVGLGRLATTGGTTMLAGIPIFIMGALLSLCCVPGQDCFAGDDQPPQSWNADAGFSLPAMDTGVVYEACASKAPWGTSSWGVEQGSFQGAYNFNLSAARFRNDGDHAYLFGKNLQPGRVWGCVRYVQGDIWGASSCGPRQYHIPQPQPLRGKHLVLELDCLLDTANLLTPQDSWIMAAINLWLTGAILPAGKDRQGRKPLVIDLYIYNHSNMLPHPIAWESEDAFHLPLELQRAEIGHWGSWRIDLTRPLAEAIAKGFPELYQRRTGESILDDLSLYQLDFVLELVNAEAAATIDNFRLLIQ